MLATIFFSLVVLMVVLTPLIFAWDRRRARNARVEPEIAFKTLPPHELRRRIEEHARANPALLLEHDGEDPVISWSLPQAADSAEGMPLMTYALQLRIGDDAEVKVMYGEGRIAWQPHTETGAELRPTVDWKWDMAAEFGRPLNPGEVLIEPLERTAHTRSGLVLPLQQIVLEAGYSWQPVIDMESTNDPVAHARDALS